MMNKLINYGLSACAFLLIAAHPAWAGSNNSLGGIVHGQVSADLSPKTAAMTAVEVGPRNYRVSGTVGMAVNPRNRLKMTGEWLWQDIDYSFLTSVSRQWVQQSAVGVGYQFVLNNRFINYLDLSGYYSHAPSKNLASVDFIDVATGNIFVNLRRIAGSNAGGISPGVHFIPWRGAEGSLAANWDDVQYDTVNTAKRTAKGFGGTLGLTQALQAYGQNFKLGASAAFRAPFDYYGVEADWVKPLPTSLLTLGIFVDYTRGKQTLVNTSLVGINLSYAIDTPAPIVNNAWAVKPDSLLAWVSQPAVYMPQVLAVSDGSVNRCTAGSGPSFSGQMMDILLTAIPYDISTRFTGNGPRRYSLTKSSGDAVINPSTGVITSVTGATNVVVTATGPCGPPASTNAFAIITPNVVTG